MYYILFLCIGTSTCITAQYPTHEQCAYGAKTFQATMIGDGFRKAWLKYYCQPVQTIERLKKVKGIK